MHAHTHAAFADLHQPAMLLAYTTTVPSYAIAVTAAERRAGGPSAATAERAAETLNRLGYVALTSPGITVDAGAATHAHDELDSMLERLTAVGIDPATDSFSFAEAVHRSRLRYDMPLDLRRTPPSAPWEDLSRAVAGWATPVLAAAGVERLEHAVEGLLTSLPGAEAQRWHSDGECGFNVICPLVDVGAHRTGTEFWPASHTDPAAAERAKALLAAGRADAPEGQRVEQPRLAAGDVLLYDYRAVHRGPANPGPHARPLYYSGWADAASRGDYNVPHHRTLADLERRQRLFGLRGGACAAPSAAAAGAAGATVGVLHGYAHGAASCAELRGFCRSLPCDGETLYVWGGEAPLAPSGDPSCFLAPSADGGATRRLLALAPIAAGAALTLPFGLDAARLRGAMEAAVLAAAVLAAAPLRRESWSLSGRAAPSPTRTCRPGCATTCTPRPTSARACSSWGTACCTTTPAPTPTSAGACRRTGSCC